MTNVVRFPGIPDVQPVQTGLTYVVPDTFVVGFILYRQPIGRAEPDFIRTFDDLATAATAGRDLARQNGDRFVVDEGVPR